MENEQLKIGETKFITKNTTLRKKGTSKRFACEVCNRDFPQKVCLQIHLRTHTGEKPWVCDVCKRAFAEKRQLGRHFMIHTGEKPYTCDICNKTFRQKENLTAHLTSHSNMRPYKCKLCSASFKGKVSFKSHVLKHSGIVRKPHACSLCPKTFVQKKSLRQHLVTHTGQKPFVCDICSKAFALENTFKSHVLAHFQEKKLESHACGLCGKTFGRKSSLNTHFLSHTGEKRHVCQLCNKSFTRNHDLKKHSLLHTGEKPFTCDVCSKKFSRKCHLKEHLNIHSRQTESQKVIKENKFKCHLCNRAFDTANRVNKHLLSHELKPYNCNVCSDMFKSEVDLEMHQILHFGGKICVCSICNRRFRSNDTFPTQLFPHNQNINLYICDHCKKMFIRQNNATNSNCLSAENKVCYPTMQKNGEISPDNMEKSTTAVQNQATIFVSEREKSADIGANESINTLRGQKEPSIPFKGESVTEMQLFRKEGTSILETMLLENAATSTKVPTSIDKSPGTETVQGNETVNIVIDNQIRG